VFRPAPAGRVFGFFRASAFGFRVSSTPPRAFSGAFWVIRHSVVRSRPAIEAAFCSAMHFSILHPYLGMITSSFMSRVSSLVPIERNIYLIRGLKVMLDRDLAALYGVETRVLNQAVRRNMERFPKDFLFSLTRKEVMRISQFVISSDMKFSKHVFVFTEQGVAMLSSVLNSPRAVQVNIEIMRAFVRLREVLATNRELSQRLAELERKFGTHDEQIQAIFEAIRQLMAPQNPAEPPRKQIGFHIKEDRVPYRIKRTPRKASARRESNGA
jgi:hypothetical protein